MLTKPIGPTGFYALSNTTTGTHTASTFNSITGNVNGVPGQHLPALKVRIATHGQPAAINFGNNKTANLNSDLIQPADTAEHYKLDNTSVITFIQIGNGSNGYISITPVA
jgi:hypothetical protein